MTKHEKFAQFTLTDGARADLKHRSVRGAAWMGSWRAVDLMVRVASIPVLARLLTPEDFGLVAMVLAVTAIVDGFADLGLGTAAIQRQDLTHTQVSGLFWVNASAGALFSAAFCAMAPAIALFYGEQRLVHVSLVLSVVFVLSGLSVQHVALMSRQLRQGELAFSNLAANAVGVIAAIFLAIAGWGYWALVWREILRGLLMTLFVWIRCQWVPGRPTLAGDMRAMLRFGGHLSLANLISSVISSMDRILIGRLYGPDQVGLYRQSQQLLLVPVEQLNAPIMSVAQPGLSALQSDPSRYSNYYVRIVEIVALATMPLGLFVAIYAREVTLLMLGPAWSGAANLVRIFGVAAAVRPALATTAAVLVTCGHSRRYLVVAVFHSVVLCVLMFVGARWGAVGVALAHVGTTALLYAPKLYYSLDVSPVRMERYFEALRMPVIASSVMVCGLLVLHTAVQFPGDFLSLTIGVLAGGALYVAGCLVSSAGRHRIRTLVSDVLSAMVLK